MHSECQNRSTSSVPDPETGQPIGLPVDSTPAPRPGPVTLQGRYGRVEKLKPEHAVDLWNVFAGQDQVWTYISTDGPFASEQEFTNFIAMRAAAEDPYAYAIIDAAGRAVGYFTLLRIVPQMRVVEVGHVLYSPALQRTPLGTEAQYLLARYVFETLGYRRYEWKCNSFNAPSRRAALRYGFSYEGTFRNYIIAKGHNRDDAWFSMLDSEWASRKASFERWLAPENFDAEGRQKIGLTTFNGSKAEAITRTTAQTVGPLVDTTPARRPEPVMLQGQFGTAARLDARRDAAALWSALGDHLEVWTYISSAGPFADQNAFTAWLADRETKEDPYFFTVLDQDGVAVGLLALMAIRSEMRAVEIGSIVYGPGLQRTPLGTETQYLLARYAFETLGYRRYEWKCNSLNAASRRAALRYGFTFEAIFRQHMITKGRTRDTAWYSIIDGEWPARKASFERWLAPDNFDNAGRQKVSLAALNGQQADA
jgi:RimJ/RimL family protein N-acetyltransferase